MTEKESREYPFLTLDERKALAGITGRAATAAELDELRGRLYVSDRERIRYRDENAALRRERDEARARVEQLLSAMPKIAGMAMALERSRTILGNMAQENEGAIFNRWPINHEPLRGDAKRLLPIIDAALAPASPSPEPEPFHAWIDGDETAGLRDAVIEECASIADAFICGGCGMDGKAGAAIRALAAKGGDHDHS